MNRVNLRQLENQLIARGKRKDNLKSNPSKKFSQILKNFESEDFIRFSKHARERLNSRKINLNSLEMKRIEKAFKKAQTKGVNDALIIMDDNAFIANIKNKTIITALNKEQLKENLFTNIDGAVII